MMRRAFTVLPAVSLVLCIGMCVAWVANYWWSIWVELPGDWCAYSEHGVVTIVCSADDPNFPHFGLSVARRSKTLNIAYTTDLPFYFGDTLDGWRFAVRYSFLVLVAGILPTVGLIRLPTVGLIRHVQNVRTKKRAGKCSNCGYDLRASTDKCPECGAPIHAKDK